jgi:glucose/arabinose dehydrogenase
VNPSRVCIDLEGEFVAGCDDDIRVVSGLNFPTGVAFDDEGTAYIAESGLPLDGAPPGGRILRVEGDGRLACLKDGLRAPVNGITYERGSLYVAEGGRPGRISVLDLRTHRWDIVLDGLPGGGDYHTNSVAVGPDGKLYFGQGSATNSGIVGRDSPQLSWLEKGMHSYDIPGRDVILTGADSETTDPRAEGSLVRTGAFQQFGTPTAAGQRIAASLPCTSAVMRCDPDGTKLELVAWGLRNPYDLTFLPDGRLLAIDLGFNDRGSRPVGDAPSCLFEIKAGAWYGWPDFAGGVPVTHPALRPSRGADPRFLLANHNELGPLQEPLARFEPRHAPTRMAHVPGSSDLIVTLFGDKRPLTGPEGPPAGRRLVRVRLSDRSIRPLGGPALQRPIDVAYHFQEHVLYVLDFGAFELGRGGDVRARARTGTLWRLRSSGHLWTRSQGVRFAS